MADETAISWTDRTFNMWWGCVKVSAGCDYCYAEAWDGRFKGGHWGPHAKYKLQKDKYWNAPLKWNRETPGHRVFAGSMCDWADNKGPESERARLWELIRQTPNLQWQLLTKRAPNIAKFLPDDWGNGYHNVWLGVTVENRKQGLPRVDILRDIPAKMRFISAEPLLEDLGHFDLSGIGWVIGGGESGPNARLPEKEWLHRLHHLCQDYGIPYHFKQWGGNGKDKGGCELYPGQVVKEFPIHFNTEAQQ